MKASELKPGQFFEFRQPGYNFKRCLWVGIDYFDSLNFIHMSAGGARFIHNEEVQFSNPEVTIDVPQSWDDEQIKRKD
jgi:hypothetical protein